MYFFEVRRRAVGVVGRVVCVHIEEGQLVLVFGVGDHVERYNAGLDAQRLAHFLAHGGEEGVAAFGLEDYLRHIDARGFFFGERRSRERHRERGGAEQG